MMSNNTVSAHYPKDYGRKTAIVAMSRQEYRALVRSTAISLVHTLDLTPYDWEGIISTTWGQVALEEDPLFNPVSAHALLQAQARLLEGAYNESKDESPIENVDKEYIEIALRRFAAWERDFVSWASEAGFIVVVDSEAIWASM